MLVPILKLRHSLTWLVKQGLTSVYVTTEDCQGITNPGKGFLINDDNAFFAIIEIEEVFQLAESEWRFLVRVVKTLTQEQQVALHELWYDLK
jgi:hypothetical protein